MVRGLRGNKNFTFSCGPSFTDHCNSKSISKADNGIEFISWWHVNDGSESNIEF